MSREILFKAKRKDWRELPKEQRWIEGYVIKDDITDQVFIHAKGNSVNESDRIGEEGCLRFFAYEIDPETLSQYTGLTDKNGKKIWENDIVICKQEAESNHVNYYIEIGFVEMDYGAFGLHRKQGFYRPFKDWLENYEYEVRGNIFDDQELLEYGGG